MMLSPQQVAGQTGLNYRTVLRAIEAGELRAAKLRGRLRISEQDMQAWIGDNIVEPATMPSYDEFIEVPGEGVPR